ncbi:MAG: molecular chaperone HtpG [Clostridia bacterium]|nr:molecular chaperone HtpG [Clostridia bacterium]
MAKKKFKSESKRLLELMINSIYTHKEIFLRELISNANDATDKLYYISLSDENIAFNKDDFYIRITPDKDARTLTVSDKGIGMSRDELENNLGVIAKSGSLDFKSENEDAQGDIIGQFGVGFYSAFMVAKKVVVKSRRFGSEEAFEWVSEGADGYEIKECEKSEPGTEITLYLKDDTDDEKYSEFLDEYRIKALVKKHSDYIKYPIKMMCSHSQKKADSDEYETVCEDETLNSMVPLWRRNKSELKDEDYNNFYKEKYFDFEDPVKVIHTSADGAVSYNALMFIPAHAPFDYYTKEYEKGLQLYCNGVLIMDKCSDLLPDYFGFIKGLVDSPDLSLNISREILQHDRQLKTIAAHLKKKIKSELLNMMKNDREGYEKFFKAFSRPLKFGVYDKYGMDKDFLIDLIMFYSSSEKKNVTLSEYVDRMKEDQKEIYYACGESVEKIDRLPQTELLKDKGYEILYFTEDVDEFAIKVLGKFKDKEFKSVSSADIDINDEESKKAETETGEKNKDLFGFMKETLGDKVSEVKATARLKSHPVCISSKGELSVEMEKVLNAGPQEQKVKAERVLEVNINHSIFKTLADLYETDKDKLKKYTNVLYNCALLTEGLSIDDPAGFSDDTCDLLS